MLPPVNPTFTSVWSRGFNDGCATVIALIAGACVSRTPMVKLAFSPSVVLQLTVVSPKRKVEPETGEQLITPHDPSVVGSGYVTTALHWLGSVACRKLAGGLSLLHPTSNAPMSYAPNC